MVCYMYVSLQDDDKIAIFTMDSETGKLTAKSEMPVPGGPSALAISPDRNVLYVGHRGSSELSSFRIDQNTGGLTRSGTISLEAAPTFLFTDRKGMKVADSTVHGLALEIKRGSVAVIEDVPLFDRIIGTITEHLTAV